jgi:excisionase family DNA binding protein
MKDDREDLMTAGEAAKYLNLSRQRIHYLAITGRIGRRVGDFWIFTKAELDQFDKERKQQPKGGGKRGKDEAGTLKTAVPAL